MRYSSRSRGPSKTSNFTLYSAICAAAKFAGAERTNRMRAAPRLQSQNVSSVHRSIHFSNPLDLLTSVAKGLTKIGVDIQFHCSGSSTFLQRGSPPPPPWRLLPEYFFVFRLT